MFKAENIEKKFGEKTVLKGISFEVENGTILGLLGPNGAGKTTLMRTIVGFYKMNQGKISWEGKRIDTSQVSYRKAIGYLPENNPLYINMTAGEYLLMTAELKEIDNPSEEVLNTARECGLTAVLASKIDTLSKGYRQRVGLAAALLGNPKLLILDEPTSGLDPNQIIEIRDLIKKIGKNKIIIFSTHILPEAKAICDRLLIINRGEIVLNDETKRIKNLEKKFVSLTV